MFLRAPGISDLELTWILVPSAMDSEMAMPDSAPELEEEGQAEGSVLPNLNDRQHRKAVMIPCTATGCRASKQACKLVRAVMVLFFSQM